MHYYRFYWIRCETKQLYNFLAHVYQKCLVMGFIFLAINTTNVLIIHLVFFFFFLVLIHLLH